MNNQRRKAIQAIIAQLEELDVEGPKDEIETLRDEERDAFDNMPESLQGSERGQASEAAADILEEAASALDNLVDALNEAIAYLNAAVEN